MPEDTTQFVAIARRDDDSATYVLDGSTTIADAFKLINDRRVLYKVDKIELHTNSMKDLTMEERVASLSPFRSPAPAQS